jgi:hypothetical protein
MNVNERGSGTYPVPAIEISLFQPLPNGCGCTWSYDLTRRVKYIKFLYSECPVFEHRLAFADASTPIPEIVPVATEKRGRGRPRNESGQWHRKSADSASA